MINSQYMRDTYAICTWSMRYSFVLCMNHAWIMLSSFVIVRVSSVEIILKFGFFSVDMHVLCVVYLYFLHTLCVVIV